MESNIIIIWRTLKARSLDLIMDHFMNFEIDRAIQNSSENALD